MSVVFQQPSDALVRRISARSGQGVGNPMFREACFTYLATCKFDLPDHIHKHTETFESCSVKSKAFVISSCSHTICAAS